MRTQQRMVLTGNYPPHLSINALLSSLASSAKAHPRRMQVAVRSVYHPVLGAGPSLRRLSRCILPKDNKVNDAMRVPCSWVTMRMRPKKLGVNESRNGWDCFLGRRKLYGRAGVVGFDVCAAGVVVATLLKRISAWLRPAPTHT